MMEVCVALTVMAFGTLGLTVLTVGMSRQLQQLEARCPDNSLVRLQAHPSPWARCLRAAALRNAAPETVPQSNSSSNNPCITLMSVQRDLQLGQLVVVAQVEQGE